MKKLIIFLAFLFFITLTFSFQPAFYNVFSLHNTIFGDAKYSIYCLNISSDNFNNATLINNGNGYIIKTDINNALNIKKNVSNILGESVSFVSNKNVINKIIKYYNIKIFKSEKIGEIEVCYGFSNKLNSTQKVNIDENIINIQIAFKENVLTIGTPIILGEY